MSRVPTRRVEVNVCKDDHEEEIAKFDGDPIRKETVSRNVSIVSNLKVISEGFCFTGNKQRAAHLTRAEYRGAEGCRASSSDLEGIGEETQRIQQARVAERSVEHRRTRTADPGAACRSAEG